MIRRKGKIGLEARGRGADETGRSRTACCASHSGTVTDRSTSTDWLDHPPKM
jgi:hypothetical protein